MRIFLHIFTPLWVITEYFSRINIHMKIHEIHDLSNKEALDLLIKELSKITDDNFVKNYHPDFAGTPGNLFTILTDGRYREGHGKYLIVEENGEMLCCSGWNVYDPEPSTVLISRSYTPPEHRFKYYLGNVTLPQQLRETMQYKNIWISFNTWNDRLHQRFVRAAAGERGVNGWPEIYWQFLPMGKKIINNVEQYVVGITRP
jgi:hypothetical protein